MEVVHTIYILFKLIKIKTLKNKLNIFNFFDKNKKKIPTKTGGASPSASSFQNLTLRKKVSALPFWTSPRSAFIYLNFMLSEFIIIIYKKEIGIIIIIMIKLETRQIQSRKTMLSPL